MGARCGAPFSRARSRGVLTRLRGACYAAAMRNLKAATLALYARAEGWRIHRNRNRKTSYLAA